jgi:putative oxidoreductase
MRRLVAAAIRAMEGVPQALIALIGRISIGLTFWNSGRTKVDGWNLFTVNDKTLFLFREEYKVPLLPPELAALAAQIAEHVFPVLLVIGLASRFSALALLVMTLVIQIFVYPQAYVVHGLWATVLLHIIKYGPGALSLDHLIRRRG